jgi:hypothetical protein
MAGAAVVLKQRRAVLDLAGVKGRVEAFHAGRLLYCKDGGHGCRQDQGA